jgi:hypothetical protein
MWAWDKHCAWGGLDYIRHMIASMCLAETLEDGGVVADRTYENFSDDHLSRQPYSYIARNDLTVS